MKEIDYVPEPGPRRTLTPIADFIPGELGAGEDLLRTDGGGRVLRPVTGDGLDSATNRGDDLPHRNFSSSESTPPPPEVATPKEQQERLRITGRLGLTPQYQKFDNGDSRIRFPLGEHQDDGTTTWRKVYSTGRFAERINAKGLQKGDLIEVSGTRQLRTETNTKTGETTEQEYVYAFGVSQRS